MRKGQLMMLLIVGATVAMARPLVELEERYDFGSLEEFLATSPRLSIFAEALESAGLHGFLQTTTEPLTIFAPVNEAWTLLLEDSKLTLSELMSSPELFQLVQYHIAASLEESKQTDEGAVLHALNGDNIFISPTLTYGITQLTMVNGADPQDDDTAMVLGEQINADNIKVYVIDRVLLPPSTEMQGDFVLLPGQQERASS